MRHGAAERQLTVVLWQFRHRGRLRGGRGSLSAAIPLAVAEVDAVCNHLCALALVAVLVLPVTDLEPTLDNRHAALGEIAADELSRSLPGYAVDEITLPLSGGLVCKVPVYCQSKGRHSGSAVGLPQLRVTGQTAHNYDVV